jgi:hypothetical protein
LDSPGSPGRNQKALVLHHPITYIPVDFITLLTNPFLANAMTHYFAAQIRIHDPEEYEKYLENFDEIFSQYKGEYLAIDESPTVLEGKWDYTNHLENSAAGKTLRTGTIRKTIKGSLSTG